VKIGNKLYSKILGRTLEQILATQIKENGISSRGRRGGGGGVDCGTRWRNNGVNFS